MIDALLGASVVTALAISVFFLRFHAETKDRFHLLFAAAFACLAANRVLLVALGDDRETGAAVYLVRAAAFVLIIIAVVDKNRGPGGRPRRGR